ncbi:MAG: hypothetical protein HY791_37385 [Deltaproteobacteria bacterium]|nr:hypothetical protein [Deltaproteobacteria bacterium]
MSPRARRILLVTLGLSVAGAVFGAIAFMIAFEVIDSFESNAFGLGTVLRAGFTFGAPLGAVLAPITGWLLLRYVPLGTAFLGLTVGSTIGGLSAFAIHRLGYSGDYFSNPLVTAVVGFFIAAVVLRLKYAPKRS